MGGTRGMDVQGLSALRLSGAGTVYPINTELGVSQLGSTATQGSSKFAGTPTTVSNRKSTTIATVIAVGAGAGGTVSVESHDGSTVLQRVAVLTGDTVQINPRLTTKAGFRVVGAANVDVTVLYTPPA